MAGEGLIEKLLGDSKSRNMLESQIHDDFQEGYIIGHRRFAARQGQIQALKDIEESKKPGFFKAGVQRSLKKPQKMNLGANNTFINKREAVQGKVNKTTKKFENFSEKDLKLRI